MAAAPVLALQWLGADAILFIDAARAIRSLGCPNQPAPMPCPTRPPALAIPPRTDTRSFVTVDAVHALSHIKLERFLGVIVVNANLTLSYAPLLPPPLPPSASPSLYFSLVQRPRPILDGRVACGRHRGTRSGITHPPGGGSPAAASSSQHRHNRLSGLRRSRRAPPPCQSARCPSPPLPARLFLPLHPPPLFSTQ